jgi:CRP-like cAMP-binding protein
VIASQVHPASDETEVTYRCGHFDCVWAGWKCHHPYARVGFTCSVGSIFGELGLLYSKARTATVTCSETGTLWALPLQPFSEKVIGRKAWAVTKLAEQLLTVPSLSGLELREVLCH